MLSSPTSSRFVDKKSNFLLNHLVTLCFSSMHWYKLSLFLLQLQSEHSGTRNKVVAAKAKNFLKILTPKDGLYCTLYTFCGIGPPVFPDFRGSSKIGGSQWKEIHTQLTAAKAVPESFKNKYVLKGQMNQKIEIFSFVALPSPNTKENHPK